MNSDFARIRGPVQMRGIDTRVVVSIVASKDASSKRQKRKHHQLYTIHDYPSVSSSPLAAAEASICQSRVIHANHATCYPQLLGLVPSS